MSTFFISHFILSYIYFTYNILKINIKNFDYIKIGPYLKDKGPLSDKNTNQKMYKIIHFTGMNSLKDITYKFWK